MSDGEDLRRASGSGQSSLFARALSGAYWDNLIADVVDSPETQSLGGAPQAHEPDQEELARRFSKDGYIVVPGAIGSDRISRLRQAVAAVESGGWHAVFVWMYDEPWLAIRSSPICEVVRAILGPGYGLTASLWAHRVQARPGATGFSPHQDFRDHEGRLTGWLPLDDVRADGACMHVIPRSDLPADEASAWYERKTFESAELTHWLQRVRALPSTAGSLLAWDGGLLHWGGTHSGEGESRVAISFEFLAQGLEPITDERPLVPLEGPLPDVETRLQIIARAIRAYAPMDRSALPYLPIAAEITAAWPDADTIRLQGGESS